MANLNGPTGSLMNNIAAHSTGLEPKVGMGATELCWTDRHAYTVAAVISETVIAVVADRAKQIDQNGMSESQKYEYETLRATDEDYSVTILKKRKNGRWIPIGESAKGTAYYIGDRQEYHDFSF